MNSRQDKTWKRTCEWLRLRFPTRLSIVKIRRCSLRDLCGDCCVCGDGESAYFRIRINKKQTYNSQLDALFHEWAHALTWFGRPGIDDHSGEWGLAFADIYSAFMRWNYGKKER